MSAEDNTPITLPPDGKSPVEKPPGGLTDRTGWIVIGAMLVGGCCLFIVLTNFFSKTLSTPIKPFPTAFIPSPLPNLTAAQKTLSVASTAEALQREALDPGSEWTVISADQFNANGYEWPTGAGNDSYANITREISDGKYRWDVTANQGFVIWVNPAQERSVTDFIATVECKVTSASPAEFGLVFRRGGAGNYYFFTVENSGKFALFLWYEGSWKTIINWVKSPLIQTDASNRITVIADGPHFTFFINDQYAREVIDDTVKVGAVDIAISLSANDVAQYEFDNFEVRTP